jgi:zinc-binding alcohol dehydrogenase family protein
MKAVGYIESLPTTDPKSLFDINLDQPSPTGHDILVEIKAIAVNPVDCKIRQNVMSQDGKPKILGWDAVGEVVAIGENVTLFDAGDQVFYAGDLNRPGSNAEYHLVDERIVGKKPISLSNSEAAALPLTTITAWELLFEHLNIKRQSPGAIKETDEVILVIGAAGGVGSILLQLIKALTGAKVVATASRESSESWVRELGADHVVNHRKPLIPQIRALGLPITHVASLNSTDSYFDSYIDVLLPFGKIAMIDDPQAIDVMKLKPKSLSLHLEFMFARSMHKANDLIEQHHLLSNVSKLIDQGHIKTTLGKNLGTINAENVRKAHELLESGASIGKIVLEGF